MIEIIKEEIIQNPRKEYICEACFGKIKGKHHKRTLVIDGDVIAIRMHIECQKTCNEMCSKCDYNHDCYRSINECMTEYIEELKNAKV